MSAASETRVVEGRITVHPRGFGFLSVKVAADEPVISAFVAPPALNPFFADDVVRATIRRDESGRWTASDLVLVTRTRTSLFGELVVRRGVPHLHIDREVANTDWPVELGSVAAQNGDAVVANIEGNTVRAIRRVESGAEVSLARVIARYGLRDEWSAEALAEADRAATVPHRAEGRRDLRGVPTVTVDAPSTRDIDDAISVLPAASDGAMRLLVSIADVGAFVPPDSALDRGARERATSVYLAGRVIPMLPDRLSSEWISLLPEQDRLCLTVELRIDPEGRVTASDVYESVIRSWARLDYDETAAFLDRGEISPRLEPVRHVAAWFRTASARLGTARARRGGMVIDRDEAHVALDPRTGDTVGFERRSSNSAHVMIERFMVAANEAIAVWLHDRGVPAPYRVHDEPDPRQVEDFVAFAHNFGFEAGFAPTLTPLAIAAFDAQIAGVDAEPAMRAVLRRALGSARYTVHPAPHFGLAAPLYLHFTSPIRRYADLAVHRTIKAYLAGRRDFVPEDPTVESLAEHINGRARAAARAERDRHRMLEAQWMASRIGEVFSGHVTRVRPFGLMVQIDASGIEGVLPFEALPGGGFRPDERETSVSNGTDTFAIGSPVRVRTSSADPMLGRVEFGWP